MNRILATSIFALSAAFAAPSVAADVNERGSTKDAPVLVDVFSGGSQHHTGLYVNGSLGYGTIERDTSNTITREVGSTGLVDDDATADDIAKLTEQGYYGDLNPGGRVYLPAFIDQITDGNSQDASGLVYGGGISYLWQAPSTRWGVEIGINADIYADGKTERGFVDGTPTITGGVNAAEPGCDSFCVGDPAASTLNGFVSVDRKYDIDIPVKLHFFLNDRLSIFGGAGPSFAVASLRGATSSNGGWYGTDYDNGFKETDTSIGYMLTAGFNYWLTNRIRFGAEYNFKDHSFDADGGKSTLINGETGYRNVNQHIEADDQVHAVKGVISFQLN